MRGLVALLRRETRDARWHLVTSFALAAVAPFAIWLTLLEGRGVELAQIVGRALVPIGFGLFAAATAADLVARDVATRRIDALAVLPAPIGRVWTAKAIFLAAASLAFLAWSIAAGTAAVAFLTTGATLRALPDELLFGARFLLPGLAFGAASFFFSTLLERGIAAALAAVIALVAIGWSVQWATIPAAPGMASDAAFVLVPTGLAAAFLVASRAAFVRGPIHGTSKLRLAVVGLGVLFALALPAAAATAFAVDRATRLEPGDSDALYRAFVSPNGKWVAVEEREDRVEEGASRTWLLGVDDGSCRPIADGETWFGGDAWVGVETLVVRTASFSLLDGPLHVRRLEIEPSHLDVCDDTRDTEDRSATLIRRTDMLAFRDGRRVFVAADGNVTLMSADGKALRRLFPPKER